MNSPSLARLVQYFFTNWLTRQFGASHHTVAGYRDAFRLLLRFAAERLGRTPSEIQVEALDATFLGTFLDHLELERGNSTRTRNIRLSALHAFFRYVAITEPSLALQCQRVLAIPRKRHERRAMEFLTEEEAEAMIAAPDSRSWLGWRDRTLLQLALQTGLRNHELRTLRREQVELGSGAHVRCLGKGRKMRCTPLAKDVAKELKDWLTKQDGDPESVVFPSSRGGTLSADALQRLVSRHAKTAGISCPSMISKSVTPHTLRHTAAMSLLWRGVDLSVIALWLGHESVETTQAYLHADLRLKERALGHASVTGEKPELYSPSDPILSFLESL